MSKLSKNIIYNLFGQGLLAIISFIAVKYIFKQLGGDMLGIIYFALAFSAVLYTVLEAGICSTTIREVAAHSKDDPQYIRAMIKTASLFYWSIYFILGIIIWFSVPFFVENWLNLTAVSNGTAIHVLRVLLIGIMTILPQRFYASLVRGLQKMEINNIVDVVMMSLQQLGIILILIFDGSIIHVAYWFPISYGLSLAVYLLFAVHFFSWGSMVPGYSREAIRRFIGFAKSMMSISVFSIIYTQADKLIISKLLPIGDVGYYGVGYTGLSKGSMLADSVAQAAFPSFSILFKSGDRAALLAQYRKLHDFICIITLPLFAIVPFIALPLFTYIFNGEIARTLFLPLIFLSAGFYMHGAVIMPYFFSLAVGKPEISAKNNFFALFFILPATIILIYLWGLTGAGLSLVLYNLFGYFYGIPRICKECLGMNPKDWFSHIFKIVIAGVLTYGTAWGLLKIFGNFSVFPSIIFYFSASAIFLLLAYKLMNKDLKASMIRTICMLFGKRYGF